MLSGKRVILDEDDDITSQSVTAINIKTERSEGNGENITENITELHVPLEDVIVQPTLHNLPQIISHPRPVRPFQVSSISKSPPLTSPAASSTSPPPSLTIPEGSPSTPGPSTSGSLELRDSVFGSDSHSESSEGSVLCLVSLLNV